MAEITFRAGADYLIANEASSGLGFFGTNGFGYSVQVGAWQDRTYICSSDGQSQGAEVDNNKYSSSTEVIWGQAGSGYLLTELTNDQATLNARFTHSASVRIQNAEVRCYDRTTITVPATGVTPAWAEIIHPDPVNNNNGSGDVNWIYASGSTTPVPMSDSPGSGGWFAYSGMDEASTWHDWFLAMSNMPQAVGAKTLFGLYFSCEYL